ncbi:DUF1285 domain-containing protein [Arenibaculum sp.]|jgi:hypothetical protein|uniref:DUF1285 domain-containing protein n=1 Tax=Arenibaculum sp. TaxID=2865862 RepID=UPI002E12BE9E|nr:DUF1285 domain-containing protein [Arenibaculum sp.]
MERGAFPTAEDERYDIRIARDGTWYYHGSPIGRIELVKLFSTVLRRDEAGDYWLITPAERGRIVVDDAPFVAVEVEAEGSGPDRRLTFRTNLDHRVTAGPDHPIRVETDADTGEPRPYILVRDRLEALIVRPVFYELVERAEERRGDGGQSRLGIWSMGIFFDLGSMSAP